jgi:hypothetical protein
MKMNLIDAFHAKRSESSQANMQRDARNLDALRSERI